MLTWSPAIRDRDHVFYRVSQVKAAMKNFRSFRDQCICYMAKNTRDDFPVSVKRVLARRVNSRCSNPTCGALTSGRTANPSSLLNIGLTAHATAAAPCGPRFDPNLTEEQNKFPENGILALPELWKPLSGEAEANLDAPTSNRRQEMVDHGSQKAVALSTRGTAPQVRAGIATEASVWIIAHRLRSARTLEVHLGYSANCRTLRMSR